MIFPGVNDGKKARGKKFIMLLEEVDEEVFTGFKKCLADKKGFVSITCYRNFYIIRSLPLICD